MDDPNLPDNKTQAAIALTVSLFLIAIFFAALYQTDFNEPDPSPTPNDAQKIETAVAFVTKITDIVDVTLNPSAIPPMTNTITSVPTSTLTSTKAPTVTFTPTTTHTKVPTVTFAMRTNTPTILPSLTPTPRPSNTRRPTYTPRSTFMPTVQPIETFDPMTPTQEFWWEVCPVFGLNVREKPTTSSPVISRATSRDVVFAMPYIIRADGYRWVKIVGNQGYMAVGRIDGIDFAKITSINEPPNCYHIRETYGVT